MTSQLTMTDGEKHFYKQLKSGKWSNRQRRILKALNEWGNNEPEPATCREIAEMANVTRAYVHILLKPLEELEYITVVRDRNGKAKRKGCILVNDWHGKP